MSPQIRRRLEAILARLDISPRQTPQRRPIDWLAHGFGRAADWARGHRPSVTAIEREEAMLRQAIRRRQLARR